MVNTSNPAIEDFYNRRLCNYRDGLKVSHILVNHAGHKALNPSGLGTESYVRG